MTCDRFKVGYEGQKFSVVIDVAGAEEVLGWTNAEDGGSLLRSAQIHPEWKNQNPRVVPVEKKKGPWPKTRDELTAAGYTLDRSEKCKGRTCGKTVQFFHTPKKNRMPLSVIADTDPQQWQPHWADCPDEKQFRLTK